VIRGVVRRVAVLEIAIDDWPSWGSSRDVELDPTHQRLFDECDSGRLTHLESRSPQNNVCRIPVDLTSGDTTGDRSREYEGAGASRRLHARVKRWLRYPIMDGPVPAQHNQVIGGNVLHGKGHAILVIIRPRSPPSERRGTPDPALPPIPPNLDRYVEFWSWLTGWTEAPERSCRPCSKLISAVEDRPAEVVPQTLVIQDQFPDSVRKLIALPLALASTSSLGLPRWNRGAYGLDRIGGRTELVSSNMGDCAGLSGGVCGEPGRALLVTRRTHGVTAGGSGLHHRDLAANPGADVFDGLARPRVCWMGGLEQREHMLCAGRRPERQQSVVGVRQGATTTDRDEPGIPHLREDHRLHGLGQRMASSINAAACR